MLALALHLAVPGPGAAATYHVDNTNPRCTDAGGGTVKFPYCTISAAVEQHHEPGSTIAVIAGTYREQVTVPGSGVPGQPLTIRAINPGVVVDGADDLSDAHRVHHNQDTGLHFQTGTNDCISLQNCSWSNGDHGFDHVGSTGTVHVGDVAHGNYRDGFSIEGNATGTHVYNCITVENGLTTDGFDLWVDPSSIPGFTSNYNVIWNPTSQPPIKFGSTRYPTLAAYRAASGQDGESVQADPMFTNPAAGDFHLLPGSPAIDNASSAVPHWPATDASGVRRLDDPITPNTGAGPVAFADRGAYESPRPPAPPVAPQQRVTLSAPYPHPVPGPVAFRLVLPEPAMVRWGIFDVRGRALWEETRAFGAGETLLSWDGEVSRGFPVGPGVYFARVRKDAEVFVRRFVRL